MAFAPIAEVVEVDPWVGAGQSPLRKRAVGLPKELEDRVNIDHLLGVVIPMAFTKGCLGFFEPTGAARTGSDPVVIPWLSAERFGGASQKDERLLIFGQYLQRISRLEIKVSICWPVPAVASAQGSGIIPSFLREQDFQPEHERFRMCFDRWL